MSKIELRPAPSSTAWIHMDGEIGVSDYLLYDDSHPLAKRVARIGKSVNELPSNERMAARREKQKTMGTVFGEETSHILELIEGGENDSAEKRILRDALRMTVDLIPIAEQSYRDRPSQSSAYALNSLITQAREMLADISAADDRGVLATKISEEFLHTFVRDIAQNILMTMQYFYSDVTPYLRDKSDGIRVQEKLNTNLLQIAKYIEERSKALSQKIYETFES